MKKKRVVRKRRTKCPWCLGRGSMLVPDESLKTFVQAFNSYKPARGKDA